MKKDAECVQVLEEFFVAREVFSDRVGREKNLVNIATGFVAPSTSNIDQFEGVGQKLLMQCMKYIGNSICDIVNNEGR